MIWINTWGFKMSHESWRDLALRTLQNVWKLDHGQVSTLCGNLTMVKFPQTGTFSEGPTNWDILCVPACPGFLKGKIASHCIIRWPKNQLNSDMGMDPYSRERTWQLRTWSTGCSAHCGLQCLYQLRPPFLGKTAASRAGLKKTFALQLRMNHGKRQRCSLYFSLCEKLKNQATSKVTSAHWRASIKWYIKPPGMLSWWHLSKQKFIDRLSTKGVIRNYPQTQK